MHVIF